MSYPTRPTKKRSPDLLLWSRPGHARLKRPCVANPRKHYHDYLLEERFRAKLESCREHIDKVRIISSRTWMRACHENDLAEMLTTDVPDCSLRERPLLD